MYPKLRMTREQFFEITYLTKKCDKEISGMGTLIIDKDGNLEVEKLFLLEQEVSATATDLDAKSIQKCMFDAKDCKGDLTFWWHSHVNMSAFFSSVDVATIKDHAKHGMFIGLVINKRGEYQIAMGLQKPILYIDKGIELEIIDNISSELITKLETDFKDKIRERVWDNNYYGRGMGRLYTDNMCPEPMIFNKDIGKYVDNPEYFAYKKSQRKHERSARRELREASTKYATSDSKEINQMLKEEKASVEFKKLSQAERLKWWGLYEREYKVNPITEKELEEFYLEFRNML